jgi:hypothetical protein
VGSYSIPNCVPIFPNQCGFGYVRSPNGAITTLNVPGFSSLVQPVAINAIGQIAGNFLDNRFQVFLRNDDGTFQFTSPGPPPESFISQTVTGLTDTGEIVGTGATGISPFQAFLRTADGTWKFVGPPVIAIPNPPQPTFGTGIDRLGAHIIGYVNTFPLPNNNLIIRGFTQTATGLPQLFPVPFNDATSPPGFPGGINSHGEGVLENVYVAPNGAVTVITIPDCTAVLARSTIWVG